MLDPKNNHWLMGFRERNPVAAISSLHPFFKLELSIEGLYTMSEGHHLLAVMRPAVE